MKKIAIFGGWTGGNKGDLGILVAETSAIQKEIPDAEFWIPAKFPEKIHRALDHFPVRIFKTFRSYFGFSTISILKKADALVFGGGGLFFGRKFWHPGYSHILNLFFLTLLNRLFFRKKVMIFAVGASHLKGFFAISAAKFIVKNADKISVRDGKSREIFEKLGAKKVYETADPAFELVAKKNENLARHAAKIAIGFDDQFFPADKNLKKILLALEKQSSVTLFHNDTFSKKGTVFWKKYHSEFSRVDFVKFSDETPAEIIGFLEKCEIVCAAPMHAIIFGVVAGRKVLPIAYDEKVTALCEKIGIDIFLEKDEILKIPEKIEMAARAKTPLTELQKNTHKNAKILRKLLFCK